MVAARMGSSRLPGKVLCDLAGKPALAWLIERLGKASELDSVVLATSTEPSDDPIAALGTELGLEVHRGELHDLAMRVLAAAEANSLDALVRVNGDSPLLDQRLVDQGVVMMRSDDLDLVSNVRPRTYPPGQSVEVVRTGILRLAVELMHECSDREHVTSWLYRHPDRVRIARFAADPPITEPPLTLDDESDRRRLAKIISRMERPHWEYPWDEVVALAC